LLDDAVAGKITVRELRGVPKGGGGGKNGEGKSVEQKVTRKFTDAAKEAIYDPEENWDKTKFLKLARETFSSVEAKAQEEQQENPNPTGREDEEGR
jgi:hypothetical protein